MKTIECCHTSIAQFDSAIVLIRNPYDAYIAEFTREATGGQHRGILDPKRYFVPGYFYLIFRKELHIAY